MPNLTDTTPKPRSPAPHVDPVFIWPTPERSDLLFWVERNGDLPVNKSWSFGDAYRDAVTYPDHKLVYVEPQTPEKWSKWYYASNRISEDAYNWNHTTADLGGTRFDAVTRDYLVPRSSYSATSPAAGSAMPDVPSGKFSGYILVNRVQKRTSTQLDSIYVAETRTYIKRTTTTRIGVDSLNGLPLSRITTLYYTGEEVSGPGLAIEALVADTDNSYWGLQADGYSRTVEQLSGSWYAVTTEQIIGGTFAAGVVGVDSFTTNETMYWPPILDELEFLKWARKDGGEDVYPAVRFSPEGYRGPTKVTVTRTWSKTPVTVDQVEPMQPTRIYYASPFFTLNIPECLHGTIFAECEILSTSDPVYDQNTGSKRYFGATNHTSWPTDFLIDDDQQPFRGGYLRTRKVATPPTPNTDVDWTTGT